MTPGEEQHPRAWVPMSWTETMFGWFSAATPANASGRTLTATSHPSRVSRARQLRSAVDTAAGLVI
jgi:hypothetical protein